ncbi:pickpocket protein 28-like [Lutzomyia longipalpis]|uniref:Putative gonad-specific amiloride-sensitive sodium channel 1 n=1 Tax=Lutzomyia longipalpis TaxID=7200 RepID=A0A1B0GH50_LUTLO|nr:pickpocket protein 28-like [Lutzomyia longipalpis]
MQRKSIATVDEGATKEPHLFLNVTPNCDVDAVSESPTEKELGQRIKHGNCRTALWGFFSDYCYNSTIHGVKYLGERRRPWIERVWWGIAFGFSIFLCASFIWSSWKRWQQSPVIVTFADKSTPIWQIPFPAVTICPETKVTIEFLNFTKSYNLYTEGGNDNLTEDEQNILKTVYQTCDFNLLEPTTFSSDDQVFANNSFAETLKQITPHDLFFFCRHNNSTSCRHFAPILTDEGICFTFNMLNGSEIYRESALHTGYDYPKHENEAKFWSLEDGYESDAPMHTYPHRALGDGVRSGLYTWLYLSKADYDYLCRGSMQGFKVLLHSPDEVPQVAKHYFRLAMNQEITVSVKPSMFTTSDGLREYDPIRRQCFFNHERELKFFKIYTQRNCELECVSVFTKEKCSCVKFSMPREADTPICGAAKVACYMEAEYELLQMEIAKDLNKSSKASRCNCLPACTSIVYEAETSPTELKWKKLLNAHNIPEEYFSEFQSVTLSIFFKDTQFITSKRSELYGLTNFIANCGGILGLFMGVSWLSIIEIIYFCSIRLFCNLRMRRRSKNLRTNLVIQKPPKAVV